MQNDFHYYATYCAAFLAGYDHGESLEIAYSAQFVDYCSRVLLGKIGGPGAAATTQLQLELMDITTNRVNLQDITRIWASFHFLPGDLTRTRPKCTRKYLQKYRLICDTNGSLLADTVSLAKGRGTQAAGLAMHVLADTWAHRYFAGTPSLVINNTTNYFYEIIPDGDGFEEIAVSFNHNPGSPDVPEKRVYTNSLYQGSENSVMNLGHGRAGHLPDYSYARYRYLPAWADYAEVVKDNPSDYYHAFCQMVYALRCLRSGEEFQTEIYDMETTAPWENDLHEIIEKRQDDASADWKALAEKISGQEIEEFDLEKYQQEYIDAGEDDKDDTFLGRFFIAALAQKSMVTNKIYSTGNPLAGVSVDYDEKGFQGIEDFKILLKKKLKSKDIKND